MTKYYTREHEWIAPANNESTWRVGITDYAQDQLGDVVTVELPDVGSEHGAGDACSVVESVKSASDIYAPVAGKVVAINERLDAEPELVNQSPEEDGWLFEIQTDGSPDLTGFIDDQQYSALIAE